MLLFYIHGALFTLAGKRTRERERRFKHTHTLTKTRPEWRKDQDGKESPEELESFSAKRRINTFDSAWRVREPERDGALKLFQKQTDGPVPLLAEPLRHLLR